MLMYVIDDNKYRELMDKVETAMGVDGLREAMKELIAYLWMRDIPLPEEN